MPIDSTVTINELTGTDIDDAMVDAFVSLIPQLSSSSPAPTREQLARIADADCNHLLVAVDSNGTVLGSMTLVVFEIPTGVRAWIEDVVVDSAARGRGVGELLNRTALDIAYGLSSKSIDLTSRPTREAANRLYQKIGFEERDTNVYRHKK